jgi:6-phosphogluconate dehydrogenase
MSTPTSASTCELGMVGLGVMGRNLLLNIADHGHAVVGYDRNAEKIKVLNEQAGERPVHGVGSIAAMIAALRRPRVVMMLVPAGQAVDAVIRDVLPRLEPGDTLINGGNSHFTETNRRAAGVSDQGVRFLGVGISGGARGARHGPSLMPGGDEDAYALVRPLYEDVAARVDGDPCVTYLGPGSAGHYVKMVHNGIEYGVMQIIAESYDLMRRGLRLDEDELHDVYERWNDDDLSSYLMEITASIFQRNDEQTGERLINLILDEARQKGTGMWMSEDAMELQIPVPTIDSAVAARDLSALGEQRRLARKMLHGPDNPIDADRNRFIASLKDAVHAGMIAAFTQGLALLRAASGKYGYRLNLADVARVWRGGCIIRTTLLAQIRAALREHPDAETLLLTPRFSERLNAHEAGLRHVVGRAVEAGIPVPSLSATLAYVDGYRAGRLPANLIQAQRDYFGSHTYERTDREGGFHTDWAGSPAAQTDADT